LLAKARENPPDDLGMLHHLLARDELGLRNRTIARFIVILSRCNKPVHGKAVGGFESEKNMTRDQLQECRLLLQSFQRAFLQFKICSYTRLLIIAIEFIVRFAI
jgi:hypothetical protein